MSAPGSALVERALVIAARQVPDAGAVALVREVSEAVVRWANSTLTTNGLTVERRLSVIVLVPLEGGTGAGVVTVPAPTALAAGPEGDAVLEEAVAGAVQAARRAGPARDAAPLPAPEDAQGTDWDDGAGETSMAVFARLAEELGASFRPDEASFGFAEHRVTTSWLGTSAGVRRRWVEPGGSVELNLKDPATGTSVWGGEGALDVADVDVTALVERLRDRLPWGRRRIELPAGRYETLLPPSAVSDLMIYLAWSMGGRPAQEGRSAFSRAGGTRVGERLGALPLTLAGDPAAPGFPDLAYTPVLATTSSGDEVSVFDNGATTGRVEWVRDGTVATLAYPRAAAAEYGAPFAAPTDNLVLTGGEDARLEEMVASTERGLLLTCLWYIREVDPTTLLLTGLTRDGVYLVEHGEIAGEVNNFRFNESPLDLLRRATEAGATERTLPREWKDWFTRAAMPPLRVPDYHMTSVSLGR
ncbi:metallopeptidase TldD-related protein [Actinomycetospora straminea]|uniref:Metallopeptidase TldD-related protein n=1 Tax=Actinomycetospora straminea TaxID=663607 RepID=A0ABP9EPY9_9PSEU|nr:metallopeptidase TldD-related protein [Actinomycetospora straminea]MDD7934039.1 metallopeptidase TldD-related protein [Actinomycetospora straminea]